MKQFLLAAALLGATATTALAQGHFPAPPTEAVKQANKQSMISKTNELEAGIKANKTDKAEAAAAQILTMMKRDVRDTRYAAEATTGAQKDALMKRMLMLENRVMAFSNISKDVKANSSELVSQARTFTSDY